MRAFRPSRFGLLEEAIVDPVQEVERVAKMRVYARRARAQQPLFQDKAESHPRFAKKGS